MYNWNVAIPTNTPNKKKNKKFKSSWNFSIYNVYNRKNPYFIYLGLEDNIDQRMQYFGNNNYKAVVNIGGGVASVGTSFNLRLLQPGIVYRKDIENISRGDGIDGEVVRFSKQNIPLIHILNIQKLSDELGMEYAPIPFPVIGEGRLYAIEKYDLNMTILSLLIVSKSVVITGWKSKQQIKEIMTNHDPESII